MIIDRGGVVHDVGLGVYVEGMGRALCVVCWWDVVRIIQDEDCWRRVRRGGSDYTA